jgi:hypothetical protein
MKLRRALNRMQDFANEPDGYHPCVPCVPVRAGAGRSTIVTQARDMLPFTVYHAAAGCQFRALCGCMGLPWPAGFTCNWNLNARVLPQECEAPLRWGHSGMAGFQRRDSQLSRQPACLSISITNSCANRFGAAATSGSIDSAVAICQFYLHGGLSVFEHLLCCLGSAARPARLLPLAGSK